MPVPAVISVRQRQVDLRQLELHLRVANFGRLAV